MKPPIALRALPLRRFAEVPTRRDPLCTCLLPTAIFTPKKCAPLVRPSHKALTSTCESHFEKSSKFPETIQSTQMENPGSILSTIRREDRKTLEESSPRSYQTGKYLPADFLPQAEHANRPKYNPQSVPFPAETLHRRLPNPVLTQLVADSSGICRKATRIPNLPFPVPCRLKPRIVQPDKGVFLSRNLKPRVASLGPHVRVMSEYSYMPISPNLDLSERNTRFANIECQSTLTSNFNSCAAHLRPQACILSPRNVGVTLAYPNRPLPENQKFQPENPPSHGRTRWFTPTRNFYFRARDRRTTSIPLPHRTATGPKQRRGTRTAETTNPQSLRSQTSPQPAITPRELLRTSNRLYKGGRRRPFKNSGQPQRPSVIQCELIQ
jgi:hypothetical protein